MTTEDKLIARMEEILADPAHPLMAAAIGVIKDGEILFADAVGDKQLGGDAATGDTKYRIASISKLLTAAGIWRLIERGQLDPEADASEYVGFRLRNPHHPGTPITVKMLLSHTSSIRDGGVPGSYNIPLGHHISEFFTPGSTCYMPRCWAPAEEKPGQFFAYCNMNYCLLGSIIENVSGERFDRYMVNHIFAPLGLSCSFNVSDMPPQVQAQVGTLYRKLTPAGECDPVKGIWTPQCDDFSLGYPDTDYSGYVLGTNGSLFGPMGSLRVSVRELCRIMQMFCCVGPDVCPRLALRPGAEQRRYLSWHDALLWHGPPYFHQRAHGGQNYRAEGSALRGPHRRCLRTAGRHALRPEKRQRHCLYRRRPRQRETGILRQILRLLRLGGRPAHRRCGICPV